MIGRSFVLNSSVLEKHHPSLQRRVEERRERQRDVIDVDASVCFPLLHQPPRAQRYESASTVRRRRSWRRRARYRERYRPGRASLDLQLSPRLRRSPLRARCSSLIRYAGEDTPKTLFPTAYSTVPASDPSQPPSHVHGVAAQLYRPRATVQSFVQDGIVTDWHAAERAIDHAFSDRMRLKSLDEYPLLVTEPSWNTKDNRERMCELAFEKYHVPAYYAVDKAVMSSLVVLEAFLSRSRSP